VLDRALAVDDVSGVAVVGRTPEGHLEVLRSTYGRDAQTLLDAGSPERPWPLIDAIAHGEPVWLRDTGELGARYPHFATEARSAAWVALPLRVAGRVVGAIGIAFGRPQPFDDAQRLFLLALADLCAVVLDSNILAERRSESQLRALVESNVVGVFGGVGTRIDEANDAFLKLLGLDRAALTGGIDGIAITPPDHRDADSRAIAQANASGRFGPYDKEFWHTDGRRVPVRIVGAIISGSARPRWIAIVEDRSHSRRVEAELRAREARYRSLVEAADTIVWTADPVGRFCEPNPDWSSYTGQTAEEASGHGWLDAVHPDDRGYVMTSLVDARRRRASWQGRARVHHAPTAGMRRCIIRAVPLVGEDDAITEWVGTVTDVDDQTRTEEILRATTARLSTLMRHAPVGFAFIDHELRFQVVNEKLAEINGLSVHEHLGRDVREVVPDLAETNERLFRRVLAGEPILETEVTGATPADPARPRDWLVNYYPVRDAQGAILGIGATVIDVTERNQLLAAERDARAAAEASARLSEALSATSAAIANVDDDRVIAREAGDRVCEALGADGVLFAHADGQGHVDDVLYARGYTDEQVARLREDPDVESWSTRSVIPRRTPVFYELAEEFLAQFPSRAELVADVGARSWVVFPLVAGDHATGFGVVMFRTPHRFTSDERRFVATAADIVAQSMLRARAHRAEALTRHAAETLAEAIAAERARLAAVLHRMPAGLVVVDGRAVRPRVALANTRAAEILGPPPPDDDADAWLTLRALDGSRVRPRTTPLHRALRGDETTEPQDGIVTHTDGTTSRVRVSAVPIRDGEQRVTSAVVVIEDVTEQARRERDARLLAGVSDLIGSAGDVTDLLDRVVSLAVPIFCDACAVYVVADDALHLFAVADRVPERAARIRQVVADPIPLRSARHPLVEAVRRGRSVLLSRLPEVIESDLLDRHQRDWLQHVLRPRSALVVPLRTGDRVTGVLTFTQAAESERTFTADDIEVAVELATRSALLLEQIVAHDETAKARDRADRLQRFAAAMARAASVNAVVQAIVVEGADAVDATLANVAMRSHDEAAPEVLHTVLDRPQGTVRWHPVDPAVDSALLEALRSGRPGYYPDLASYRKRFDDGELVLIANGVEAVAALPLVSSDARVIGAVEMAFDAPQRFDDEQRSFLGTVSSIAAQSLDRARLYERERDVARALQLALLPAALPELDDVTTEARYVAGGAGVSVGGDWYDVLRFADGRVGLLIGDAAGRGVEAATLMGKVRHAAAALAMDHVLPAAVLARVNEFLHTISTRRMMLTCTYIVLDRDRGVLRYASAGHPPPVVVEGDGEPKFLHGGRGVPLGVLPSAVYEDAEHQLHDAATIVLYTDGLVERRGETIDTGLERLLATIRGHDGDVTSLCNHLTATLLADAGDDDVALLVARVEHAAIPGRLELELPADPRRLHELRARVRRWLADANVPRHVVSDVVVALNEAVSNSMLHAYTGTARRGHVHVTLTLAPGGLNAVVADRGAWREQPGPHDGRGIVLMRSLMTDVHVEHDPSGTRVHLVRAMSS
jgi:PAS domain S-box-containing protein